MVSVDSPLEEFSTFFRPLGNARSDTSGKSEAHIEKPVFSAGSQIERFPRSFSIRGWREPTGSDFRSSATIPIRFLIAELQSICLVMGRKENRQARPSVVNESEEMML